MNNLTCGGAEKALISLLETIDYSKYNVDLYLFKHEGLFLTKVPSQVNLLNEPMYFKYFDMSFKKATLESVKMGKFVLTLSRMQAGYIFKTEKNPARCEQRVWKYLRRNIRPLDKVYDVAVGFLEKNPVYFCIDKVKAKKKFAFIHTDYEKLGVDFNLDQKYFDKLDRIITVSQECANILKRNFPTSKNKVSVMHNIISPNIINKMSLEAIDLDQNQINIVSIGRVEYVKGFDLAVEACKALKQYGYNFRWTIIGDGGQRKKLEKMVIEKKLDDTFVIIGTKENPYPYLRVADIYVQPSRSEGKSIAIDEAKILQKPIITTNFPTAKDQINHEENGLIVEMNGEAIAKGIQRIIDDETLKSKLIRNLSKEKLGTENEIVKLYHFINAG